MEFQTTADAYGRFIIYASGPVRTGDADRFRHALDGAGNRQAYLAISSGGGLVREAMRIARMVAAARVPVVVGDVCASACFLLLAASPDRTVGPASRVGVHRAYGRHTGESAGSLDATMDIARYATSLGVPAPIVGRLVTTPGGRSSIAWLTEDDLRSMNVKFSQPAAAQRPAAQVAVAQSTPTPATAGAIADAGRADRIAYRRWLAGLTDSGREGAAFWLKQRRSSGQGSCVNRDAAFSIACFETQRIWARVDERSRDPEYRRGWEGP